MEHSPTKPTESRLTPHPELDYLSTEELNRELVTTDEKMRLARECGDGETEAWFVTRRRLLEAALARRNGTKPPAIDSGDPIAKTLAAAGFSELTDGSPIAAIERALRDLQLLLTGADPIRRATVREAAIRRLGEIKVKAPGQLLDAALTEDHATGEPKQPLLIHDPDPWPEEVDGAVLLNAIAANLKRYVIIPPRAADAAALWILHAHSLEAFPISPLLTVNSATKRSGKTLLLEIVSLLAPRSLFASNITPAALFRSIDKFNPTLFVDEADTFLRDNDELRGILNASHRKASAFVVRVVGDEHEPTPFTTWAAKAIALIGKLPGTLEDRSILIQMKRKAPGEAVERFRPDRAETALQEVKRKAARWAADNLEVLRERDPEIPAGLNDRAADNWRPLLAIAELAGEEWPERAREAAATLSGGISEADNSALIQLLEDIRGLFQERAVDRLSSSDIVETLGGMEDRPWPEWVRP